MVIVTCPNCGAKNRVDPERAKSMQPVCGKCGKPLPVPAAVDTTKPITVTDASFEKDVLGADRPVLVDYWAAWCGPCRMIAPSLEQLAAESNGRYVVAKLNTDENPTTAAKYRIEALPTLAIFNRGKEVDRIIGLQPKKAIAERLEKASAVAV